MPKMMRAVQVSKPGGAFELVERELPEPASGQIRIQVEACGICHSDALVKFGAYPGLSLPRIPGHEIAGRVEKVGANVTEWKKGDRVGVGWHGGHCFVCNACRKGLFINCERQQITGISYDGGYAEYVMVPHEAAARIPEKLDAAEAAPLLCAGITTYSPLHHWGVGPGQKVGIVGLGGLGHMGVKIAAALGAHVVLFTTSPDKTADALRLGASEVVVSKDAAAMQKHAGSFDFILDTVSAVHDLNAYLELLKLDATLTQVGAPPQPVPLSVFGLIFKRRRLAGSAIGGIRETQEMLDFCAEHGLTADVEVIRIQEINAAFERLKKGDVKYRFVIDMASLR